VVHGDAMSEVFEAILKGRLEQVSPQPIFRHVIMY
jgi:hypothetical protein